MIGEFVTGPLKRYLTQTIEANLSKYISNINIENVGVGGDIILRDLELRLDVLQESLQIPLAFEFSRGFIKELRIEIYWTKIFSHPVKIKVNTVELILKARSSEQFERLKLQFRRSSEKSADDLLGTKPFIKKMKSGDIPMDDETESGSSWLHESLKSIAGNTTIEISDLVLKYEHADVVLSASFRSLSIFSANPSSGWQVHFQEPAGAQKFIFKACNIKDLTVNLDKIINKDKPNKVESNELPILNRQNLSFRARISLDPYAENEPSSKPSSSFNQNSMKKSQSFGNFQRDHIRNAIQRSSSDLNSSTATTTETSGRTGLKETLDPFYGTCCMGTLMHNSKWKARTIPILNQQGIPEMDQLDFALITIMEIHITSFHVTISDQQFILLGILMVLPDNNVDLETESVKSNHVEVLATVENMDRSFTIETLKDTSSSGNGEWKKWAWGFMVGDEDHNLDDLEAEMLGDAESVYKRNLQIEQDRMAHIALRKRKRRFVSTLGFRVDQFSISFIKSSQNQERKIDKPRMKMEKILVPVANVGMVEVEVEVPDIPSTSNRHSREVNKVGVFSVNGITLEVRHVNDLQEFHDFAFAEVFMDVDILHVAAGGEREVMHIGSGRLEDEILAMLALSDPMPHPLYCWSFFHKSNSLDHHDDCCCGGSLHRRIDKAVRGRFFFPLGRSQDDVQTVKTNPQEMNLAFGTISCQVGKEAVSAFNSFFSFKNDTQASRFPYATPGTAAGAIKDLANEYASKGKSTKSNYSNEQLPWDILLTFPYSDFSLSNKSAKSVTGVLLESCVFRSGLNLQTVAGLEKEIDNIFCFPGSGSRLSTAFESSNSLVQSVVDQPFPGSSLSVQMSVICESFKVYLKDQRDTGVSRVNPSSIKFELSDPCILASFSKGSAGASSSSHVPTEVLSDVSLSKIYCHVGVEDLISCVEIVSFTLNPIVRLSKCPVVTVPVARVQLIVTNMSICTQISKTDSFVSTTAHISHVDFTIVSGESSRSVLRFGDIRETKSRLKVNSLLKGDPANRLLGDYNSLQDGDHLIMMSFICSGDLLESDVGSLKTLFCVSKVANAICSALVLSDDRKQNNGTKMSSDLKLIPLRDVKVAVEAMLGPQLYILSSHLSVRSSLVSLVIKPDAIGCHSVEMTANAQLTSYKYSRFSPKVVDHDIVKSCDFRLDSKVGLDSGDRMIIDSMVKTSILDVSLDKHAVFALTSLVNIQSKQNATSTRRTTQMLVHSFSLDVPEFHIEMASNLVQGETLHEERVSSCHISLRDISLVEDRITIQEVSVVEKVFIVLPRDSVKCPRNRGGMLERLKSTLCRVLLFLDPHGLLSFANACNVSIADPHNHLSYFMFEWNVENDMQSKNLFATRPCLVFSEDRPAISMGNSFLQLKSCDLIARQSALKSILNVCSPLLGYKQMAHGKKKDEKLPLKLPEMQMEGIRIFLPIMKDIKKEDLDDSEGVLVNIESVVSTGETIVVGPISACTFLFQTSNDWSSSLSTPVQSFFKEEYRVLLQWKETCLLAKSNLSIKIINDEYFEIVGSFCTRIHKSQLRTLNQLNAELSVIADPLARIVWEEPSLTSFEDLKHLRKWGIHDSKTESKNWLPLKFIIEEIDVAVVDSSPSSRLVGLAMKGIHIQQTSASRTLVIQTLKVDSDSIDRIYFSKGMHAVSVQWGLSQSIEFGSTLHFIIDPQFSNTLAGLVDHLPSPSYSFRKFLKEEQAKVFQLRVGFEESETHAKSHSSVKLIIPGISILMQGNGNSISLCAEQVFCQRSLKGIYRQEVEVVVIGMQVSQDFITVVDPCDCRITGTTNDMSYSHFAVDSSTVNLNFAPSSVEAFNQLANSFTQIGSPEKPKVKRKHPINAGGWRSNTNDLEFMKKIYDSDPSFLAPSDGQVTFGAHGCPLPIKPVDMLDRYEHAVQSLQKGQSQNTKMEPPNHSMASHWVAIQWQYYEPRKLNSIEFIHELSIPKLVAKKAIYPESLLRDTVECQLCYWSDIHHAYVVVHYFDLPLAKDFDEVAVSMVDEFADAFQNLVEMSVEGEGTIGDTLTNDVKAAYHNLEADGPIMVFQQEPSHRYMLRWRANESEICIDDRLAVCSAIHRAITVSSLFRRDMWHTMAVTLDVQQMVIATCHESPGTSELKELFNIQISNVKLASRVHSPVEMQFHAKCSSLRLGVQDFGTLTATQVAKCTELEILGHRVLNNDNLNVALKYFKMNLSRKTILPLYHGVTSIVTRIHSSTPPRDDVSMQYILMNLTGRPVWYGQYGTAEVLRAGSQSTNSYSWRISNAFLTPSNKDKQLLGQEVKHTQVQPLMRFAFESSKQSNYPGTWSQPLNVDNNGVHKRSLIWGSVDKNLSSAFFGNEPTSNLWIVVQTSEKGLQTCIRLIASHMVASYVPMPLDLKLFGNSFVVPSGSPPLSFEKREVVDGAIDQMTEGGTGFIDECEFEFQGAGMFGLVCPDIATMDQLRGEAGAHSLQMTLRSRHSSSDWSSEVPLSRPRVEVLLPNGDGGSHLVIESRQVHITSQDGKRLLAWTVLEIWPTCYVFNRTKETLLIHVRGKSRLEKLQDALSNYTPCIESGWPVAVVGSDDMDSSGSMFSPATSRRMYSTDGDSSHLEEDIITLPPDTTHALFLNPSADYMLLLAFKDDLVWCDPLRLNDLLFVPGTRLNREVAFSNQLGVIADAVAYSSSLCIRISSPLIVSNTCDHDVFMKSSNDKVTLVARYQTVHLAWRNAKEISLSMKGEEWSSVISLSHEEDHVVALPVDNDSEDCWLAQLCCNLEINACGIKNVFLKPRIVLRNNTGLGLQVQALTPMSEDRPPSDVPNGYSVSPLSFSFGEAVPQKQSPPTIDVANHSTVANWLRPPQLSDATVSCRLLSTLFRIRTGDFAWSEPVFVASIAPENNAEIRFHIQTTKQTVDVFRCEFKEIQGHVELWIVREDQPQIIVCNTGRRALAFLSFRLPSQGILVPSNVAVGLFWHQLEPSELVTPFEILSVQDEDEASDYVAIQSILRSRYRPVVRFRLVDDLRSSPNVFERAGSNAYFRISHSTDKSLGGFRCQIDDGMQVTEPIKAKAGVSLKLKEFDEVLEVSRDTVSLFVAVQSSHGVRGNVTTLSEQKLVLNVHDVHVSLFDSVYETLHLNVKDSEISVVLLNDRSDANLFHPCLEEIVLAVRSRWVQLDSHVAESEVPVVLYCLERSEDTLIEDYRFNCLRFDDPLLVSEYRQEVRNRRDQFLLGISWCRTPAGVSRALPAQFRFVSLHVAPIAVAVEDALLRRLVATLTPLTAELLAHNELLKTSRTKEMTPTEDIQSDSSVAGSGVFTGNNILAQKTPQLYIRRLQLGKFYIVATLRTTTLPISVSVDKTPLRFSAVVLEHVCEVPHEILKELAANYIADAILDTPSMIGSLEILGNPVGFARSVGAGFYDLFALPLRAVRHGYGPGGIMRGIARGWTSLLLHVSEGALMSVSGFSSNVARNLDRLCMNQQFTTERETLRRRRTLSSSFPPAFATEPDVTDEVDDLDDSIVVVETSGEITATQNRYRHSGKFSSAKGLARGILGLGQGMVGGATEIVVQPIHTAMHDGLGFSSIIKGVSRGLLGALAMSLGGAAELVAQTSGGIMEELSIGTSAGPGMMRSRRQVLWSPNTSLRLNWKFLPAEEPCIYQERGLFMEQLVEFVLTVKGLRLFKVPIGKVKDTVFLYMVHWSNIKSFEEPDRHGTTLRIMLVVPIDHTANMLLIQFAEKTDRRNFVKTAIVLRRQVFKLSV